MFLTERISCDIALPYVLSVGAGSLQFEELLNTDYLPFELM